VYFTGIKNIGDIYYPINWDNFYNKTNYILVEYGPTREILPSKIKLNMDILEKLILILSFKGSKKLNYINIVMLTFLN